MSRRRYVSTDISDNEALGTLVQKHGYFAALLYTWLIPHADDQGSLPSKSARKLLVVVTPQFALLKGRYRVHAEQIETALEAMKNVGLLLEDDESLFFPPKSFYKHQTYVPDPKRRSTPLNADEHRASGENAATSAKTPLDPLSDVSGEIAEPAALSGENAAYPSPSSSPSLSPSVLRDLARETADDICDPVAEIGQRFAQFGKVTAGTVQAIAEAIDDFGPEWTEKAVRQASGAAFDDKPPWRYVESILERWKKQGGPDEPKELTDGHTSKAGRHAPRRSAASAGSGDVTAGWQRYADGD